ncbi:hypothetical protein L345_17003 [Ophiophagus hannah]|uniref:Cystatin domain-containing protein n=1 Tax=Ophiophagus hannah TaxID=8665 RepID=V8N4R8_OPHHA|nr:hypothetical protein L345_17003 [Ophiophagus hannah]
MQVLPLFEHDLRQILHPLSLPSFHRCTSALNIAMNSLVTLVLLGQIIGCTFSHHLLPQLDCNGEEAEKLAELAVQYINEHNLHGYKQALNVIKDVHVLPRAVEGDCDVKLLSDEGIDKVVASKCHSDPDSVEDVRRNCLKCPILIPRNDPHVVQCVEYVLHKHNEKHPENAYEVLEISRGQHQVGHSHAHLIEHHHGKNIASPGHNNTVLDLVHSHNHTSASHESHSHEHVAVPEVVAPVAKREAPTEVSHDHTHAIKLCPGKVHHFKL